MYGMLKACSVQLNLVARQVPVRAKKLSIVKRLERFLNNAAVRVRPWYQPVATHLLRAASSGGQVRLVIDASKVAFGFQLLMVAVCYQRRSLPIAWTWLPYARGHSATSLQVKLLNYVRQLLPVGVQVLVVGDSEFGHPLLLEYVTHWGWQYALRQVGDHLVMLKGEVVWRRLDSVNVTVGEWCFLPHSILTQASAYPTHLLVFWAHGEDKPWFLATNLPTANATIRSYRLRMWIEEMFGDMKRHGFELEDSHLRCFLPLSRLTLAVCFLYVWLTATGEHLLHTQQTHLVDRRDRQDLSIFRLGMDFICRCMALDDPLPSRLFLSFDLVSGG
jgi:hypothetical protein